MIHVAERDLEEIQSKNFDGLKELYNGVQTKFKNALTIEKGAPDFKDMTVYKPEEVRKYGQEFMGHIDPEFIQDMHKNHEWYQEHLNQFLLNINYPCKLQFDFLKELELA